MDIKSSAQVSFQQTPSSETENTLPFIADLVCIEERYIHIRHKNRDFSIPFQMCNSQINGLEAGDRVVVTHTQEGLYIDSRAMKADEAPAYITQNERGEMVIKANSALVVQTPTASIVLDRHGNLRLKAENIHLDAKRDLKFSGSEIHIS